MKTLSVNSNNDLFLDSRNNIALATDLQALAQHCEQVVKVVVGELVFDLARGVLGFEQNDIFGNTPDLQLFEFRARKSIRAVAGVIELSSFSFDVIDNIFQYNAEIQTIYGSTPIQGGISV